MYSIIGGRIRCEMGKSGYECYRQTTLAQLEHNFRAHKSTSGVHSQECYLRSWQCSGLFSPSIVGGSEGKAAADAGGDRESGTDNWR